MLEPQERRHLMEALRPPAGYELDRAIGTTFSLDLLALLTAPLAFTIFDWADEDGRPTVDPLALLESLRRYADRISIFCQAGQIAVSANRQLLFGYLEDSVLEVTAPNQGGVFHPKVWALRFVAEGEPALYRLLCLSRNLTFDRSWDTILVLEGELGNRKNAYAANHPLGEFFEALPRLALRPLHERVLSTLELMQYELRRVWFEPPPGFESVAFWPLGLSGSRQWPFKGHIDRMLVVSPFVKDGLLQRLPGTDGGVLVSRPEALSQLKPASIEGFGQTFILQREAESEDELPEQEPGEESSQADEEISEDDEGETLTGLHAKLFVADAGWDARVWTGSANATNAAFRSNVEFLVEMSGKKSQCGIDKVLSQPGDATGFADLLQEYTLGSEPSDGPTLKEKLRDQADAVRHLLSTSRLTAMVMVAPGETERFEVRLQPANNVALSIPDGVSVRCWPITISRANAVPVPPEGDVVASFSLSLEAITSFFAFEVTAVSGEVGATRRFVSSLALEGAPEGRRDRIVRSLLSDKDKVMRLILFLLAEGDVDEQQTSFTVGQLLGSGGANGAAARSSEIPLFEELVRALWSNPEALDRIESMLSILRKTEEGARLVPEELNEIWEPLLAVRQRNKV